jgi:hypothetical protein
MFALRGAPEGKIDTKGIAQLSQGSAANPEDTAGLKKVEEVLTILKRLGVSFDLWQSQNIYFSTGKALYGEAAAEWVRAFKSVGELLRVDPSVFLPSKLA